MGWHTCACHGQGMGQLRSFNYTALAKWVEEELDNKEQESGMGWIGEEAMERPPHTDVPGVPPSYTFMRMLLWVGAERDMAACPHVNVPHINCRVHQAVAGPLG